MTRIRFALATAAALLATTTIASADYRGYGAYGGSNQVDRRQDYQEQRIQQGLRSGQLTRGEYYKLESEQARIRHLERSAKADGYISPAERARLRSAQNEASRHIYQEKHDGQNRGSFWRRWYR